MRAKTLALTRKGAQFFTIIKCKKLLVIRESKKYCDAYTYIYSTSKRNEHKKPRSAKGLKLIGGHACEGTCLRLPEKGRNFSAIIKCKTKLFVISDIRESKIGDLWKSPENQSLLRGTGTVCSI